MNTLELTLLHPPAGYAPREPLRFQLRWELDPAPTGLTLRLFWFTEGKGPCDIGIVREEKIEFPGSKGDRQFEWMLPVGPPSFAGSCVSLHWAVEAFAPDTTPSVNQRFVLSPTRSVLHIS